MGHTWRHTVWQDFQINPKPEPTVDNLFFTGFKEDLLVENK